MGNAFLSDELVRQRALTELTKSVHERRLLAGHIAWTHEKCSAVGCIIQSDDLEAWEQQLGLPAWFALVFEAAAGTARDADGAARIASEMLETIEIGTDLDRAGSRLVIRLLSDLVPMATVSGALPGLNLVIEQLIALHLRFSAGEEVPIDQWKIVRRSATRLTDNLQNQICIAVARCAESAAWNPQRSRSAVLDTLREWTKVYKGKALLEYGWTADRDAQVQAQLDHLYEQYVSPAVDPKPNVFDLYEQHLPHDAEALRAKTAFERESYWSTAALSAEAVLAFLREERAARTFTP